LSKDTWYATVDGRKVSLGVRGEGNRKAAQEAWHRLMADGPKVKPEPKAQVPTVRDVCDAFLVEAPSRLKPKTVRIYRDEADRLGESFGTVTSDRLTAQQLTGWLSRLKLSATSKSISIRAVSAIFSWAVKAGLLAGNPARDVPRPRGRSRSSEAVITDADHAKLVEAATPGFRLVLRVLHATGARPGEVCRITAETFHAEAGCVVLHEHKTDHTGKPRLVFLPPDVCDLLKAQAERFGTGPLLRSRQGVPWSPRNVCQAMKRLCRKTGLKAIAYGYRHSFATQALANGVPDAQVAALLGHSTTTMLHRHYSHLTAQAQVLRDALARVRGLNAG
jgi:integrase